jgi:hypothetical protein
LPDVQWFNFAPGLWVAVCAEAEEDTQGFWVCKIISIQRKRLNVHCWDFYNGHWADQMPVGLTMLAAGNLSMWLDTNLSCGDLL